MPKRLGTFSIVCVPGNFYDLEMVAAGFRFEDKLEGESNFIP
jgi:hypothetical protein